MNKSRIWWGQMALMVTNAILWVWGGVQWIAYQIDYDPWLGPGIIDLFGHRVYGPWAIVDWVYHYHAYQPAIFDRGMVAMAVGSLVCAVGIGLWYTVRRSYDKEMPGTYGTAHWATEKEVKRTGLLEPTGVFLAAYDKDVKPFTPLESKDGSWPVPPNLPFLRHEGPEHLCGFAPTRSGKGVGMVLPTLLTWPGSVIVHDLKRENWELTSGYRAKFTHAILFDPTNPASARFNPLLEVRKGETEVRDAQNVADIIVDPDGALQQRDHWQKTSHTLLTGAILHVLYAEPDKSLHGVARLLSTPGRTIEQTLHMMMTTKHLGDRPHDVVAQCARMMLDKAPNEQSGIISTAQSYLDLYRDPIVAAVTSASDFRISDLIHAQAPVSLYLAVPPSDQSRTKPLIRLMLSQISRRLTETHNDGRKHRVLMMLDEFPALGRLEFFETALAFFAGYGVRCYLIAQSLNQIEKAYGANNSILDNCHVRITFSTNDERTAKRISEQLGQTTEMKTQRNYAGHRFSAWLSHSMVTASETQRALATQGEIMQMPETDALVMVSGQPPIYARKLRHYLNPDMVARTKLPPPKLERGKPYPDCPPAQAHDWLGHVIITSAADDQAPPASSTPHPTNTTIDEGKKIDLPAADRRRDREREPNAHAHDPNAHEQELDAAATIAAARQLAQAQTMERARTMELGREEGGLPL